MKGKRIAMAQAFGTNGRAPARRILAWILCAAASTGLPQCSSLVADRSYDEESPAIHRVPSTGAASTFQLHHIPRVERDGRTYTVSVKLAMDPEHRIQEIRVYRRNLLLSSKMIPVRAERAEAIFSIDAQPGEVLRFIAKCNRHGVWETSYEVPAPAAADPLLRSGR
jgi:desulfoferrodoxin (superoxide reductase-like protein)